MRFWSGMSACVVVLALVGSAGSAQADRRVYTGTEAQALKCAWIISMTATTLEQAGLVSTRDKETATFVSAAILAQHVSGSERQKLEGFRVVGARRSVIETVSEFRRESRACIRKFPLR